jgi:hypothetical protein
MTLLNPNLTFHSIASYQVQTLLISDNGFKYLSRTSEVPRRRQEEETGIRPHRVLVDLEELTGNVKK